MSTYELNIDGLVGPTHHYAGLSAGNIASTNNALSPANPMASALQGISKMRLLHQLGIKQAFMPPHLRPNLALLRQLGFSGTNAHIVRKAKQQAPELLSACYSAASMWTANAATVSPSRDTTDKRVHFTAANLITNLHRQQESSFSRYLLQHFFSVETYFHHHPSLPTTNTTRDEGAANHSRLCQTHGEEGIHLFVYNQQLFPTSAHPAIPTRYPARQTREASEAVARSHLLNSNNVVFAQQTPAVVDLGVFHNDVIAVANESVLLIHQEALVNQESVFKTLQSKSAIPLTIIEINHKQMSVVDAVKSYFFNSQLVTLPNQKMALIAPHECSQLESIKTVIDELLSSQNNPITEVHFQDLKQSMRNGGGPACLRLRVVLNQAELSAMHQGILVNDSLLDKLEAWVKHHYRTELHADDLDDPSLITESYTALDELTILLNLGPIYL